MAVGVIGEQDVDFENGSSEDFFERFDTLIDLYQSTALGHPGISLPLPLGNVVLAVEGQMIGELADDEDFSLSGSLVEKRPVEKVDWSHAYIFNNLQIDPPKRRGLTALPSLIHPR